MRNGGADKDSDKTNTTHQQSYFHQQSSNWGEYYLNH